MQRQKRTFAGGSSMALSAHSGNQRAHVSFRIPLSKSPAQLPGPRYLTPSGSGNQRLEARVPLEQFEILDPAVESEDVARALDD